MGRIRVTQKRSTIGRPRTHRRTIKALGLRRINHSVVHEDTPTVRGMVFKVKHLVEVEELSD